MATDLTTEVYLQMRRRKSDRAIRNDLVDRGYTEEYADKLVAEVRDIYPALRSVEKEGRKVMRKREQREWGATTIGGIAACAFGVAAVAALFGLFWLEPFGWGIWQNEEWARGPFVAAVFVFLGGVLAILKGTYHRIRWW